MFPTNARLSSLALILCVTLLLVLRCTADSLNRPSDCDPGEWWDQSRNRCSNCPAGTFTGVSDATSCCTCCAGYYQDGSGKSSCKKCPGNKPYSTPGATSISQCRSGSGAVSSCSQTDKNTCPSTGGGITSPRAEKRRIVHAANGAGAAPPRSGATSCPFGWRSCPIWGMRGRGGEPVFECIDVRRDLESCGGCVYNDSPFGERTAGGGRDCSAIPNVDIVRCDKGECMIGKCLHGFYLTEEGDRCLPYIEDWEPPILYAVGK
ncbi:hypothetical protein PYCCODRAFT_1467840 [Trametes coccinea BRFM310]|uniref:Tyrosine-protein kinase ephrin type A/B receptor-like domain-containing protein n=1 Tax=Trametes coccinea (strain BRFM310) TaxID=1353009 RepID=A0A1Y2IN08_TRAC3|nr:hypothetical protein PYCCODRAFT_1467840 [Trametes coccinea BRFM310]